MCCSLLMACSFLLLTSFQQPWDTHSSPSQLCMFAPLGFFPFKVVSHERVGFSWVSKHCCEGCVCPNGAFAACVLAGDSPVLRDCEWVM